MGDRDYITDPEFEIRGFRIGSWVAWHGKGTPYKIVAFHQAMNGEHYALGIAADGKPCNFGVSYIAHVDIVTALAHEGMTDA
jgi:hypothetical protein